MIAYRVQSKELNIKLYLGCIFSSKNLPYRIARVFVGNMWDRFEFESFVDCL